MCVFSVGLVFCSSRGVIMQHPWLSQGECKLENAEHDEVKDKSPRDGLVEDTSADAGADRACDANTDAEIWASAGNACTETVALTALVPDTVPAKYLDARRKELVGRLVDQNLQTRSRVSSRKSSLQSVQSSMSVQRSKLWEPTFNVLEQAKKRTATYEW